MDGDLEMSKGWHYQSARHALAARGIKTVYEPPEEMRELTYEKARDFSWHGDNDIPDKERWGPTVAMHRDSGPLQISNFETISEDMIERFPEDTRVVHSSHWGVGWADQLFIRMYNDDGPTEAYEAAMEWNEKLQDYPVADEEDYSRREYEDTIENIKNEGSVGPKQAKRIHAWLFDNDQEELQSDGDQAPYPSRKAIDEAVKAMRMRRR
jgi:hypothetical protein